MGGYCYINNAAILAMDLLRLQQDTYVMPGDGGVRKIAILDVDYHAGNGTAAIFWEDPNVFVAGPHQVFRFSAGSVSRPSLN